MTLQWIGPYPWVYMCCIELIKKNQRNRIEHELGKWVGWWYVLLRWVKGESEGEDNENTLYEIVRRLIKMFVYLTQGSIERLWLNPLSFHRMMLP